MKMITKQETYEIVLLHVNILIIIYQVEGLGFSRVHESLPHTIHRGTTHVGAVQFKQVFKVCFVVFQYFMAMIVGPG